MNPDNSPEIGTEKSLQRLFQPLAVCDEDIVSILEQEPEMRNLPVWNNTLIADYNVYRLCRDRGLPYYLQPASFKNIFKAGSYICSEQMKRPDLTAEYQKYLVGQKFLFEDKQAHAAKRKRNNKNQLAESIGAAFHLSYGTVLKYGLYAAAVDYIYEASDSLATQILTGKIRISHENVLELSRLRPEELKNVAHTIRDEDISHLTFQGIRMAVKGKYTREKAVISRREKEEKKESEKRHKASIRQMPAYDPDAEVNSLCMTISSWVSSIERVNRSVDYSSITGKALYELIRKLTILEETIKATQHKLVERENR